MGAPEMQGLCQIPGSKAGGPKGGQPAPQTRARSVIAQSSGTIQPYLRART